MGDIIKESGLVGNPSMPARDWRQRQEDSLSYIARVSLKKPGERKRPKLRAEIHVLWRVVVAAVGKWIRKAKVLSDLRTPWNCLNSCLKHMFLA